MSGFNDWLQAELPKRPFTALDGAAGQVLVRSSNPLAPREMEWADPSGGATYVAASVINGHTAFTLDGNGQAIPADASNPAHSFVEGLTKNAASIGDNVVAVRGTIDHAGWSLTAGLPVYLGLSGALTQVLPIEAVFSKVLGVAVSPTRIKIEFQPAVFL